MKRFFRLIVVFIILGLALSNVFAEEKVEPGVTVEKGKEKVEPGIVVEKGGILIGKGRLIFEPGFQYTHISTQRLDITGFTVLPALVVGIIQVEKIKRDILTPSVTLKYGITEWAELDIKVPYSIRYDEYTYGTAPDRVIKRTNESGFGDVEGALLFHIIREKGARPDVILSIKGKSRTGKDPYGIPTETTSNYTIPRELPLGSGHWAVEPGLTFVKTAESAVVFANISYFYHIERDAGHGIGTVDPSDSINYSLGVAYAVSDKVALSTAFEQKFYNRTKVNGAKQPETNVNVASLLLGASYAFGEKTSLSLTIGIGLTPESPDIQVSLRMPINLF
ncbi:MAG: transporter [Nitrospirota bacterium]